MIDGDTVVVRALAAAAPLSSTAAVTVRLLEIDTPETVAPGSGVECFGPEASAYTRKLLPVGAHAFVVADQDLRDRYGRYLLYLWRADGLFVNEAIVTTGHGAPCSTSRTTPSSNACGLPRRRRGGRTWPLACMRGETDADAVAYTYAPHQL